MTKSLLVHEHVSPFASEMSIQVVEQTRDQLQLLLPSSSRFHNRKGDVHGGAVTSLIDTTLGMAATEGDPPGTSCSTLTLTVNFLAPARGELRCVSRVVRRGRSIRFLSAEVFDTEGNIVANGSCTFKVFYPR